MYYPFLSRRWFKQQAKSSYARVTLNWTTALFFIFSHLYFFAQGMVQSLFFTIDLEYSTLVDTIVDGHHIPSNNMTFLQGSLGHLRLQMCNAIPNGQSPYPCTTIFNSTNHTSSDQPVHLLKDWEGARSVANTSLTIFTGPEPIVLNGQCVQILKFPSQILQNLRREDITWIALQFWLLAISFIAITAHSIPHALAVLSTRILSAAWAAYAIWRGPHLKAIFHQLLADPGTPCSLDLFTDYWNRRHVFQIADILLNSTGLILFSLLSWNLLKTYSAQSFKCVGPPEHVMNIHKYLLALLANLQLEIFVLIAGTALWIDILTNTAISNISPRTTVYETIYVVLFLPWIAMGWYAIRYEMKRTMILFLLVGFAITSGWAVMFSSTVFRWSFFQWPFLACFTVFSLVLLFTSMVLGIVCRLNFGKGLKEYLRAEATLSALNFAPDAFPFDRSSSASSSSKLSLVSVVCPKPKLATAAVSSKDHKIQRSSTQSTLSNKIWGAFSSTTLKLPSSDDLNLKFQPGSSPVTVSAVSHVKSRSSSSTLKLPPSFPSSPVPSSSEFKLEGEELEGTGGSKRASSSSSYESEITSVHLDLDEYFMQDKEFASGAFGFGGGFNGGVGYVGYVDGGKKGRSGGGGGPELRHEQQQQQQGQEHPAVTLAPRPPPLQSAHSNPRAARLTSGYTIGRDWKEGGGWEEDSEKGPESLVHY